MTVKPIGWVSCAAKTVADVPSEGLPSDVVLRPEYESALKGIEAGDHLYVVAVFDRADRNQLTGSTGTPNEQGAFSIRSSSRPNRIGLTLARVTSVYGASLSFDWLDFADATPVIDIKRYNWRWECVVSARRLDRRFIESQIAQETLQRVLRRPAENFHGERCRWTEEAATLGAILVHEHGIWLGDPELSIEVRGDSHLIDALQGMTGSTHGNGRLQVTIASDEAHVSFRSPVIALVAEWGRGSWTIN